METRIRFAITAVFIAAFQPLPAQEKTEVTVVTEAVKLRADTVVAVAKGAETPTAAISRLKSHDSPNGVKTDHDADVGFATFDVGQRLIATGKPAEAEPFFQEAEKSLQLALQKMPDEEAAKKAMLLQNLAFMRGNYLNKAAQARADIEAAMKLQPEDKHLRVFRDSLAKDKAEVFKDKTKN